MEGLWANNITIQNYFKNYSKFKIFPIKSFFRPNGRPGGRPALFQALSVDRSGRPGLVALACTFCARLPVDRTGRPTDRPLLSGFVGRPGQSTDRTNNSFCLACGRPIGRPSPTALLPCGLPVDQPGRPTAVKNAPTVLS